VIGIKENRDTFGSGALYECDRFFDPDEVAFSF
jgi:hypothetical protein